MNGAHPAVIRILFVCMGNICRSPAAESVMRHLLDKQNLQNAIEIDSAGTLGYHAGNRSDPRIRSAGERRGYQFVHRARQVTSDDFARFDYIVAMDHQNVADLQFLMPENNGRARVSLLMSHCTEGGECEVPDPYYGGSEGFEDVLNLVEKGCAALLNRILADHRPLSD